MHMIYVGVGRPEGATVVSIHVLLLQRDDPTSYCTCQPAVLINCTLRYLGTNETNGTDIIVRPHIATSNKEEHESCTVLLVVSHCGHNARTRGGLGLGPGLGGVVGVGCGASLHFSHAVHAAALHSTRYWNLGETQSSALNPVPFGHATHVE